MARDSTTHVQIVNHHHQIIAWVASIQSRLKSGELRVMLALASHCNLYARCHPSLRTLSADTGQSVLWTRKCIDSLVRKGILAVDKGHPRKSNRYTLACPKHRISKPLPNNPQTAWD